FYTHAYNFGQVAPDTTINGVVFRGVSGVNPSLPGTFSSAGLTSQFNNDANILTTTGGGSALLARDFIYGGQVQSITLTNLYPGIEYIFTFYSVAFDASRTNGRAATFSVGNDRLTINHDQYNLDNGIRISYR